MSWNIYKIFFKEKEYLIFTSENRLTHEDSSQMNDILSALFKEDSNSIILFPSEVKFYGFPELEKYEESTSN